MMSYFTTHLLLNLLVKEFLKLVNNWRSYRQNGDSFMRPICIAPLPSKIVISPDKLNNLCMYYGQKVLLIVVMSIGTLMWVYYKQISNCCRPVLTYWLRDWRRQWLADCWSCTAFYSDSFSLFWQLCTVGHGIFYMADVNNFLLVN